MSVIIQKGDFTMKLNGNFLTQDIDDTQVMIATGDADFSGIVRSNPTAAEIIGYLNEDTTEEAIVEKMTAKYGEEARKDITEDVKMVLDTLRKVGALDE
jgi:hypothetical protein